MNDKEKVKDLIKESKELSEFISTIELYKSTILSKWLKIVIIGFVGAGIGLALSFILKPKYEAHLSFAMIENEGGGKLSSLASMFGFGGLTGGSNGAYSGNNLLEIIQSRQLIERTLLSPVDTTESSQSIVDLYIDTYNLRKKWNNSDKAELHNISFKIDADRVEFSRVQDSILFTIYKKVKTKLLNVSQNDPENSIIDVDFSSKDEVLSKRFTEELISQTYQSYKETKTKQSRINIEMLENKADSVKLLYENAIYNDAGIPQMNINTALMYAAVPKIKQATDIQIYATIYTEILKNSETLKLEMAQETPILQVIDTPIYPLKKKRLGHIVGFGLGGILGGLLSIIFFSFRLYFKRILSEEIESRNKANVD